MNKLWVNWLSPILIAQHERKKKKKCILLTLDSSYILKFVQCRWMCMSFGDKVTIISSFHITSFLCDSIVCNCIDNTHLITKRNVFWMKKKRDATTSISLRQCRNLCYWLYCMQYVEALQCLLNAIWLFCWNVSHNNNKTSENTFRCMIDYARAMNKYFDFIHENEHDIQMPKRFKIVEMCISVVSIERQISYLSLHLW